MKKQGIVILLAVVAIAVVAYLVFRKKDDPDQSESNGDTVDEEAEIEVKLPVMQASLVRINTPLNEPQENQDLGKIVNIATKTGGRGNRFCKFCR